MECFDQKRIILNIDMALAENFRLQAMPIGPGGHIQNAAKRATHVLVEQPQYVQNGKAPLRFVAIARPRVCHRSLNFRHASSTRCSRSRITCASSSYIGRAS